MVVIREAEELINSMKTRGVSCARLLTVRRSRGALS